MSIIDVRNGPIESITEIKFADYDDQYGYHQASHITRHIDYDDNSTVRLIEGAGGDYIRVNSQAHAQDLIKALEKAIELGWLR